VCLHVAAVGPAFAGALLEHAVVALHFTGMSAITIVPDASVVVPEQLLSGAMLTLAVGSITSMIILGGLGAVAIESQTSRSALERIRRLANAAYEGLVVVQSGKINDANAAFCELVGAELSDLVGRPLLGAILTFDEAGPNREGVRREGKLQPIAGGREIPVEVFSRLMDDGARIETSGLTVLAVRDLRERRAAEEKIRYLAEHDGLTGLPNRNSLQARLAAALERVEASGESLSVICIDLDHFKEANDQHGHVAGDEVLRQVGETLRSSCTRASDLAARYGGEEFAVIMPGTAMGGARLQAEKIRRAVEALGIPHDLPKAGSSISVSIGVATIRPSAERAPLSLVIKADEGLYLAKHSGRNQVAQATETTER